MATTESSPATVSERQARQVAEAARESEWRKPSFGKELFLGRFRLDLIDPRPEPDQAKSAKAEEFLGKLGAYMSTVDGLAYVSCAVQPRYGGGVDVEGLAVDLRRGLSGEIPLERRLAPRRTNGTVEAAPRLMWQPATHAAVLEVRAADSPGLLYRITHALEEAGADVRAARISTLGTAVVDAFYLEGTEWGDERRAEIEKAVLDAVNAPTPATAG